MPAHILLPGTEYLTHGPISTPQPVPLIHPYEPRVPSPKAGPPSRILLPRSRAVPSPQPNPMDDVFTEFETLG